MGVFGALGYLMRKFHYEPAPLVLAFVLGEKMEEAVRQSLIFSRGDFSIFLERPIAVALFSLSLLMLISPLFTSFSKAKLVGSEEDDL
jgi:putative tricarboxylic transport membrane protein